MCLLYMPRRLNRLLVFIVILSGTIISTLFTGQVLKTEVHFSLSQTTCPHPVMDINTQSQLNIIHLITLLSTSLPWNCFHGFITFLCPYVCPCISDSIARQFNTTFVSTNQIQILIHVRAFIYVKWTILVVTWSYVYTHTHITCLATWTRVVH